MSNLQNLLNSIVSDGVIDSYEVQKIKTAIYQDGKIDSEEANFLFDLNDACSGSANSPEWTTLFVDAICSYLLEDTDSPGEIDEKESEWLLGKLQNDGQLDDNEKQLLNKLKLHATKLPSSLEKFLA